jgi:hypothetical protein
LAFAEAEYTHDGIDGGNAWNEEHGDLEQGVLESDVVGCGPATYVFEDVEAMSLDDVV